MSAIIDYYFTAVSPYVYLGHQAMVDLVKKHGASIHYKPVLLPGLWEVSGSVPLAQRSPTRQRYRLLELQRAAFRRGLPINLKPKFFPADPALADHVVIALLERQADPTGFMGRVFAGVWANEENVADADTLARYLEAEGHDVADVLHAAQGDAVKAERAQNTADAVSADAIGVPAYVLNGEVFWGQDRIEDLALALETGRAPFTAG